MVKIEYRHIKEIHDKYSAIILSLRQQFAKFEKERERREEMIKKEAEDPINEDLPISNHIRNFLEWDTNALLLEEQTIQTYMEYLNGLYQYLREVKNQAERITELTEELERKEEDLELMSDIIKKGEDKIIILNEEKRKLLENIGRLKNKQWNQPNEIELAEVDDERDKMMDEIMEQPKRIVRGKRLCEKCGVDISDRRTSAKYCVKCKYLKRKEFDRERTSRKYYANKRKKEYDSRGDEIQEGSEEDESESGEPDGGEPNLEEGGEYEEANVIENDEEKEAIEGGEESEE